MVPDGEGRLYHRDIDKGKRRGPELQQDKVGNSDNDPEKGYYDVHKDPAGKEKGRRQRNCDDKHIVQENQRMPHERGAGIKKGFLGKTVYNQVQYGSNQEDLCQRKLQKVLKGFFGWFFEFHGLPPSKKWLQPFG